MKKTSLLLVIFISSFTSAELLAQSGGYTNSLVNSNQPQQFNLMPTVEVLGPDSGNQNTSVQTQATVRQIKVKDQEPKPRWFGGFFSRNKEEQ